MTKLEVIRAAAEEILRTEKLPRKQRLSKISAVLARIYRLGAGIHAPKGK